jgi:3-oxoacyl-[acyl-carrier protein] reductase
MTAVNPKTVLITGGTRGIGRAITERLASEGYRLALTYRNDEKSAQETAQFLDKAGSDFMLLKSDLADPEQTRALPSLVYERFGSLDHLVNNAGMTDDGSFLTMEAVRYQTVMATNLIGTLRLTAAALPLLSKSKLASIVFLSSLAGISGKEGQTAYGTTKGGIIGLTKLLARRYGAQGLRVNAVAPGFIETDMVSELAPSTYQHILDSAALPRMGKPAEVADTIAFLLSEAAGYINASTIKVDGGFSR